MNSELAEGKFIKPHEPSINGNFTGSLKRFLKPTISTDKEVAGPPSKARMNSELAEGEFIKLHEPSINENYTGSLKRFLIPDHLARRKGRT